MKFIDFGKRIIANIKNFYNKSINFSKRTIVNIKNFYNKSIDFSKSTYTSAIAAIQNVRTNHRKYYMISLISLGALAGAGVTFVFGLGLTSAITSMFPKLLTKMVLGMFIAVPTAGIVSGNVVSNHLCKSYNIETNTNNNFKRFIDTSLISLAAVASASVSLVCGLGAASVVNFLFPKLSSTLVTLGVLASTPVISAVSSIIVSDTYNNNSFDFDTRSTNSDYGSFDNSQDTRIPLNRHSYERSISSDSYTSDINIPRETFGRSSLRRDSI